MVAEDAETCGLDLAVLLRAERPLLLGWLWALSLALSTLTLSPYHHNQHIVIFDTGLLECLVVAGERLAVEEEILRVDGEVGLGLHEALEVGQGEAVGQVEVQQLLVGGLIRRVDGYGYTRPFVAFGELVAQGWRGGFGAGNAHLALLAWYAGDDGSRQSSSYTWWPKRQRSSG